MTRRASAFTLIETLLALALLVALSGSVFGFVNGMMSRREIITRTADEFAAADVLFDRLERSLQTATAGGGALGSGVRGGENWISVVSRESIVEIGSSRPGVEAFRTEFRHSDAGQLTVSHAAVFGGGGLGSAVLSERVVGLRLRYHDGKAWRSEYDSAQSGRLPLAVEVAIWFGEVPSASDADDDFGFSDEDLAEPMGFDDIADEFDLEEDLEGPPPSRVRVIVVPDMPKYGEGDQP